MSASKPHPSTELFNKIDNSLNNLVTNLADPSTEATIKAYLAALPTFHKYSFNNVMNVLIQAEERGTKVSRLASYESWHKLENDKGEKANVLKGEKGYKILVPIQVKRYERDEEGNKKEILDENGEPVKKMAFTVGSVFDVAQTNAKEIGAIKELEYRTGADFDQSVLEKVADKIRETYNVEVRFTPATMGARGYFNEFENLIAVNNKSSLADQMSTLMHELGHSLMHRDADYQEIHKTRGAIEGEAEAFSYAMSSAFGIENKSELYISAWGNDADDLKSRLEFIGSTVKEAYKVLELENLVVAEKKEELAEEQVQ